MGGRTPPPATEATLNPCDGLPEAAHKILLCLQHKRRVDRPFEVSFITLAQETALSTESVTDHVADLLDLGFLARSGGVYRLRLMCPHRLSSATVLPGRESPVPTKRSRRKVPAAFSTAQYITEAILLAAPMSLGGNVGALAKNVAVWHKSGLSYEIIRSMGDEFVGKLNVYCPEGFSPWKSFVGQRERLLKAVRDQFVDLHQWDDDFDTQWVQCFGVGRPECNA